MRTQHRKKGQHEASANAAPIQAQFQSRPFPDASFAQPDQQTASPEVQLQQQQQGFQTFQQRSPTFSPPCPQISHQ